MGTWSILGICDVADPNDVIKLFLAWNLFVFRLSTTLSPDATIDKKNPGVNRVKLVEITAGKKFNEMFKINLNLTIWWCQRWKHI